MKIDPNREANCEYLTKRNWSDSDEAALEGPIRPLEQ